MAEVTGVQTERPQFQKPQINLARPTAVRMWLVSFCALIVIMQSSLGDSFSSLLVAIGALAGAVVSEMFILFYSRKPGSLKDGSAVASALILALLLPNRISPAFAAAGAIFAMVVVKHSFGGLGSNWLNPAAGGWLFIRFSWPHAFRSALENSPLSLITESVNNGSANAQGSPLEILKTDFPGFFANATTVDKGISSFLNNTVFSLTGAVLPEGYLDLFVSRLPGIIADRGGLALLIGTIIITASQVNRSWIPAVYLVVFCFLVRVFGALPYGGSLGEGDIFFTLCTGGALVVAFILAADPSTSAKSNWGILIATVTAAALAFVFRFAGAETYGGIFAVIFINACLPLFRIFESWRFYGTRRTGAPSSKWVN